MRESLHAEWTKLRTVPSAGWLLATAVVLTVGVGLLATSVMKCPTSCGQDPTKVSLTGIMLGQAAVAVLAVLVVSGEYSTGMIRITLTAVPRRATALAAKAAVVTAVVIAGGAVAVLGCVLAAGLILPGNGFTAAHGFGAVSLADGPTLRAATGAVLYLALIALLSLGLATALRDSGVSIAVVLALLYVVPVITELGTLNPVWQHRLQRYGPMTAGLAIEATRSLKTQAITPWAGLGVLAAWTAAALLAGATVFRLRDA